MFELIGGIILAYLFYKLMEKIFPEGTSFFK